MALKKCKECGEEVSTKAKTCPKCGISYPGISCSGCLKKIGKAYLWFFTIMFVLAFIGGLLGDNGGKKESTTPQVAGERVKVTPKAKQKSTRAKQENDKHGKIKISPAAYKAKTVELFKELMVLKKEGAFPNQFWFSKANPKMHNWHSKWRNLYHNTECQVLDCYLLLPDGGMVLLADLYDLALDLCKGKEKESGNKYQKPLIDRFKLAVTCYETPNAEVCKKRER